MYFKKLELLGFKSFAEKTVIEFESGVTAVVGPNGCGKSNISDSIRWVLGEQSAKSLRGGSMEDVIFNGSQSREPLNLAEVSLTLSNETRILPIEYDEVTITRRLYRSGESEYLINKNTVRLRDIHEMLMGTGIGTESYSIIEQGKMDQILNSKPEERREIFEEAAGITKYKSKKKEALRKLEQTDSNLLRINDIIQEVKRQIGSIERQAKKAQIYQEEFERLKKNELRVATHEFVTFQGQKNDKDQSLEFLRQKEEESLEDLKTSETAYNEKKGLLNEFESSLEIFQNEELAVSGNARRDQDRVLLNRERVGELCERKENLSRQVALSKKRSEEFSGEFEKLNAEFEQARHEEESGLLFLNSVETEFRAIADFIEGSVKNEEAIKSRVLDNARNRSSNQNELSKARAEVGTLDFRVRRIESEKAQSQKDRDALSLDLQSFQSQIQNTQSLLDNLLTKKTESENEAASIQAKLDQSEEALKNEALRESTLRAKIDFLNDLKSKQQGFLGGVKALLDEKEKGSAVCAGMAGVLVNLLEVGKGYELAVEAALEAYLQAVVFEKDEQVLEAVQFLRASKKGRAILLSLEETHGPEAEAAHAQNGKNILEVISCPANLKNLLVSLLKNIYVMNSAEEAYAESRRQDRVICVTREGERFEGRIVMGGSLSQEADLTLVGRQFRIEQYEEELRTLLASSQSTQKIIEECIFAKGRCEAALKSIVNSILTSQVDLGDAKGRSQHLEERMRRFSDELEIFDREITLLRGEEEKLREAEKVLSADEAQFNQIESDLNQELLSLGFAVKEKALKKEDLLVRLTEVRSKQSYFAAQREKIEKDKNWALESKSNEEQQILLYEKELEECEHKKNALESESAILSGHIEEAVRKRDEILKEMEVVRSKREEIVRDLDGLERQKDEKEAFLRDAREKLHHYELEGTKIQFEIDRLKERIFNAYQIDLAVQNSMQETENAALEAFGATEIDAQDLEALKAQIQQQRDKLQKMGPVNLVAIQEFDEMRERFDFLTKQEADLVQAKDDLQKAIQKINRTTRELFVDTFAQVQKNFTEYYKMLFGGGSAELVLLDENDVLESGIEIVARPPGKKLQNISLLSGGEKALTAVALLFSLFKVKPSPFCILDEIDAPLDESNVDRFCSVLKEFIEQSQFILITHNKRTMNLADAMYGITMQQTGISRIVSVKFGDKANRKKEENKAEVLI